MLALLKRHRLTGPGALLLLALAAALYALFSLGALPGQYQYLWPAPAPQTAEGAAQAENGGLRDARLALPTLTDALAGACKGTALYAVADGASVTADAPGAQALTARLEAIGDGALALAPLTLSSGRLFYPEEYQSGTRVALLDEPLAVALFGDAAPIDRRVVLGGEKYRIVGVINARRAVGDRRDYTLYIPYRAAEKSPLTLDALCVQTQPVPGAGGWSAFEAATAALGKQGTLISLPKEKMNAAMPLRILGCAMGLLMLLFALRALNAWVLRLYRGYLLRLREQYALRLWPWLLMRALPLLAGYAACAALFGWLFVLLLEPVYTFPEWVPKVLVEPNDISAAFWAVWQKQAALTELRSPELLRARFFQTVMGWACGALALAGGLLAARLGAALRQKTHGAPDEKQGGTGNSPVEGSDRAAIAETSPRRL